MHAVSRITHGALRHPHVWLHGHMVSLPTAITLQSTPFGQMGSRSSVVQRMSERCNANPDPTGNPSSTGVARIDRPPSKQRWTFGGADPWRHGAPMAPAIGRMYIGCHSCNLPWTTPAWTLASSWSVGSQLRCNQWGALGCAFNAGNCTGLLACVLDLICQSMRGTPRRRASSRRRLHRLGKFRASSSCVTKAVRDNALHLGNGLLLLVSTVPGCRGPGLSWVLI